MTAADPRDHEPARLLWLQPPILHPPTKITRRQERIFLLVGLAALFAGYNQAVFGFALPQIQASLPTPFISADYVRIGWGRSGP